MKLIIVIERDAFNNCNSWKYFVCNRAVKVLGEDLCSIYLVDSLSQTKECLIERWHFGLEYKNSRLNQDVVYSDVLRDNIVEWSDTEDVVFNLSEYSISDLRRFFNKNLIWEAQYLNCPIQGFTHIGERELINKLATIDILLIEYSEKNDITEVDVARYNLHYSAVRNFQNVVYSLHLLLKKNIKYRECAKGNVSLSKIVGNKKSFFPYAWFFYKKIIKDKINELISRIFPTFYPEKWIVGISQGSFLKDGVDGIVLSDVPRNEFWADPFLYRNHNDNKLYIFVERFPFLDKKGVISCGIVDDEFKIQNMHDVLVKPYHLSYPFIFEEDGEVYMMPECSANKRLEIYRCEEFPDKWNLYSCGMEGESMTDTVYYRDKNGDRWLFTTISDSDIIMHNTIMNIYKIDSLQMNIVIPHRMNPIIIDSSIARNGGRIFFEDGHIYRVAQNNTYGEYGHGITVREINKLTLDDYEEVEIKRFDGKDIPNFKYTHQMCQIDDMFVMDLRR